jgi:hypothetical protein
MPLWLYIYLNVVIILYYHMPFSRNFNPCIVTYGWSRDSNPQSWHALSTEPYRTGSNIIRRPQLREWMSQMFIRVWCISGEISNVMKGTSVSETCWTNCSSSIIYGVYTLHRQTYYCCDNGESDCYCNYGLTLGNLQHTTHRSKLFKRAGQKKKT